ncbi:MAG TPA: carboxypeptidase-like regulatory domain-containing protein [Puia sp.]|uniref:carboxypeptidase-like regulatory domain-containing protein n=1 Tax=Puia sp. TaxID=2045100 RepID=UPI002C4C9CB8|nr:carboxypeptidase-like regulatory domain-containing protein [Puia sp.]HVU97732.1 carboxypeptidase-like regulatory domain-containing protein [Puia sp.]
MEVNFVKEWGLIAGFAGLALGVFLILFREVIRQKIFPVLTKRQGYTVILLFMCMVWSLSGYSIYLYFHDKGTTGIVTVLVHGEKGKDDLVLPNRGKVKLIYGDADVVEPTNEKGEATFKQVPIQYFNSEKTVELTFIDPQNEPYRSVSPDSQYHLTSGQYVSLAVKLYGLANIKGTVTNFKTGQPIDSVRIAILGSETFSNKYGEYNLSIPFDKQKKYQTVRAFKKGYQLFEQSNVPVQTENEFPIVLKALTK